MSTSQLWHQVHFVSTMPHLAHLLSLTAQARYIEKQPCKPAVAGLAELEELNPVTWRPTARSISPVQVRRGLPALPCCHPISLPY